MGVCLHVFLYTAYVQRPEKDVGAPGSGVTDGCEPSYRWMLVLGTEPRSPRRTASVLTAEPSSPVPIYEIKKKKIKDWQALTQTTNGRE